jgi:hypothetical protein
MAFPQCSIADMVGFGGGQPSTGSAVRKARQNHPLHVTMVRKAMDQGKGLATRRAKTRIPGLARLSGELLAARHACFQRGLFKI